MDPELLSMDRLPLPSLKVYTFLSIFAASCSVYYIWTEADPALKGLMVQSESLLDNPNIFIESAVVNNPSSAFKDSGLVPEAAAGGESGPSSKLEIFTRYFANDHWWSSMINSESSQQRNVAESNCSNDGQDESTWKLLHWASQQPHCVWPLVNLAYCILILLGHSVQQSVFGILRSSEQESIKDLFWNLVFYKVVFVFGVVNVQEVEDAVGWCFFVSFIGFLQLARQLCKERHNYLIMMNDTTKLGEARRHRILGLLTFIFLTSVCCFVSVLAWFMNSSAKDSSQDFLDIRIIAPFMKPYEDEPAVTPMVSGYDFNLGFHNAIFMGCEIGLLIIQSFHSLTMCIFDHIFFRHKHSKWNPISTFSSSSSLAESDEEDLYLCVSQDINYRFEITALLFDLVHHVHMLVCCNIFLSMTSLIVSLQMRMRVRHIHAVLRRRQSFTWLNEHIDRYNDIEFEDCDNESIENCAVCWDSLASQKSKILPCNHMFHKTCLRKWLLVSMHCPTCRMSLLTEQEAELRREQEPRRVYRPRPAVGIMGLLQTGQTLLDLFGGWDPLPDEFTEGQTVVANNVPMFSDFSVEDWPAETQQDVTRAEQTIPEGTTRKD